MQNELGEDYLKYCNIFLIPHTAAKLFTHITKYIESISGLPKVWGWQKLTLRA